MEAHYGEIPGSMTNNYDIDTIVPFVPRLGLDSAVSISETIPDSRYSPSDDGCGWNCSPGETCPLCSSDGCDSATTDSRSQVDPVQDDTVPPPLADTTTNPTQATRLEHPWPQNMPEDHQALQPEANDHINLVLANRQLPGVQMVFDQQMNPQRICYPATNESEAAGGAKTQVRSGL